MHGLWALIGSRAARARFHARLLAHDDATFRAWGVRAAGNRARSKRPIREQVVKLASDPSAGRPAPGRHRGEEARGGRPDAVLLDVQQSSFRDPLIPQIVWQNLLPLLEDRQAELARRLDGEERARSPGSARSFPVRSSGCWRAKQTSAAVIAARWCPASSDDDRPWKPLDLILERFRDHSLPAGSRKHLRRAEYRAQAMFGPRDHINEFLTVGGSLLRRSGELETGRSNRARSSGPDDDADGREKREELRIRAVQAILYRKVQGDGSGTLIAGILCGGRLAELGRVSEQGARCARRC